MIYNLDTIPYKLFVNIAESGDISLLSKIEKDMDILKEIWEQIYDEHLTKNQTTESKKIFKLSTKIDELVALNKTIVIGCACLRFEFDKEIYDTLTGYDYKLSLDSTEEYYNDIDRIDREANAYIIKAENYKNMLPEKKENNKSDFNVDDVLASYSSILGFDFDYDVISYNKFYALQKQVNAKINSLKKQ